VARRREALVVHDPERRVQPDRHRHLLAEEGLAPIDLHVEHEVALPAPERAAAGPRRRRGVRVRVGIRAGRAGSRGAGAGGQDLHGDRPGLVPLPADDRDDRRDGEVARARRREPEAGDEGPPDLDAAGPHRERLAARLRPGDDLEGGVVGKLERGRRLG
jgi:hypothetical protein